MPLPPKGRLRSRLVSPLAILDRLLPSDLGDANPTVRTSLRLLTALILVCVTSGLVACVLWLQTIDPMIRVVMVVANAALIGLLVFIRRGLSMSVATNSFLGILAGSLLATTALSGGHVSSSVYSLALIPIFALVLTGMRAMLIWAGASVAALGLVLAIAPDPIVAYGLAEVEAQRLGGATWFIGLAMAMWLVTEAVRRSTMTELIEAKEELRAQ